MNNVLRLFYGNESEREAVKAFLIETLQTMAIDKTFSGESVVGIKEAHDCVEKAFNDLDALYGKIKEPIQINSR